MVTKRFLSALAYASEKHRDQRRKNQEAAPYINHPIQVAYILSAVGGVTDEDILMSALLHDTLEDTEATAEEIRLLFGERVARIVQECTDDPGVSREERKLQQIQKAAGKSHEAKLVKLADKLNNLQELTFSQPVKWSLEQVRGYFAWCHQVVAGYRGTNEGLERELDQVFEGTFEFQGETYPVLPASQITT